MGDDIVNAGDSMNAGEGGVRVDVVDTPDLGDRSYVVSADGVAVAVDPQRDIDRVLAVLEERGLRLARVLETHLHNDYVTGGLALARRERADYVVPALATVGFDRHPVADGDTFDTGPLQWRVLHTPGHTPHHVSYAVRVAGGPDAAVFTGGSLLLGSVGRPDLVSPDRTEGLAHDQWRSARRLAAEVHPQAQVLPTHGFGSFCSSGQTSSEPSTLGEQRGTNPALTQDEERFVADLLAGLDAYPAYYQHMGPLNAAGPQAADLRPVHRADPAEIRRRLEAGEWVVDLRRREAWARGHVPGSLSFDAHGNAVTYLGWLLPHGAPVALLGTDADEVAQVHRGLTRIGIDRPAAQATGGPEGWSTEPPREVRRTDFKGLAAARAEQRELVVVDLRLRGEYASGHVECALNVPLHELAGRIDDLPDAPLWVHCESGFRSAVAASLLDRAGREVVLVDDEFDHARAAGLPIVGGGSEPGREA